MSFSLSFLSVFRSPFAAPLLEFQTAPVCGVFRIQMRVFLFKPGPNPILTNGRRSLSPIKTEAFRHKVQHFSSLRAPFLPVFHLLAPLFWLKPEFKANVGGLRMLPRDLSRFSTSRPCFQVLLPQQRVFPSFL